MCGECASIASSKIATTSSGRIQYYAYCTELVTFYVDDILTKKGTKVNVRQTHLLGKILDINLGFCNHKIQSRIMGFAGAFSF